jgi:hypothetical protein
LPLRRAGKACTGSAKSPLHQIHDQSAFAFVLLTTRIDATYKRPSARPQDDGHLVSWPDCIWAGFVKDSQSHPNRCSTPRERCSILGICRALRAEVRQDGQNYLYVRGTQQLKQIRRAGQAKSSPEFFIGPYFNALKRFDRRDL